MHPIYLIDDDDAVREALALLLDTVGLSVVGFSNPQNFIQTLHTLEPGILVIDIRMPGVSGLQLQEQLVEKQCSWPVIVISGHGDIEACRRAFKNGAVDFLSKPIDEQNLIDAVQKAEKQLSQSTVRNAELAETKALLAQLTAREREVLDLATRGLTSREIASMLNVSPRTIDTHRANAGSKLGTQSIAELTRLLAVTDDST